MYANKIRHAALAGALALAALGGARPARAFNMFMPSVSDQQKVGDAAAKDIEKKNKIIAGPKLDRVQRVGGKLVASLSNTDRTRWNFRFHVIESKDVNAFAIPGGNMYIYTGLLDRIRTDDELAAVMGHEMAHVYKQHWARMEAESQKRSLGLAAVLGFSKASKGWYDVAGLANNVADLRYSRKDEDQADEAGLNNMFRAGYNPQGMLDLFAILQQAGGSGGSMPAFLRDHPMTSTRIQKTKDRIAKLKR
ncbi:MAG TPA: M48 family metalloprotease [Armatimonadota bacterium]